MSIAHCYFIALEFVKYARKSLLKQYRLDAPRISAGRSFQISKLTLTLTDPHDDA